MRQRIWRGFVQGLIMSATMIAVGMTAILGFGAATSEERSEQVVTLNQNAEFDFSGLEHFVEGTYSDIVLTWDPIIAEQVSNDYYMGVCINFEGGGNTAEVHEGGTIVGGDAGTGKWWRPSANAVIGSDFSTDLQDHIWVYEFADSPGLQTTIDVSIFSVSNDSIPTQTTMIDLGSGEEAVPFDLTHIRAVMVKTADVTPPSDPLAPSDCPAHT